MKPARSWKALRLCPSVPTTGTGLRRVKEGTARRRGGPGGARRRTRDGHFRLPDGPRLLGEGFRHGGHRYADLGTRYRRSRYRGGLPGRTTRNCGCAECRCTGRRRGARWPGQRTAHQPGRHRTRGTCSAANVLSEPSPLPRGDSQADCRLQLLASAKPLKQRAPVHFPLRGRRRSGQKSGCWDAPPRCLRANITWVRLVLQANPRLLLPGDRFIIRMLLARGDHNRGRRGGGSTGASRATVERGAAERAGRIRRCRPCAAA